MEKMRFAFKSDLHYEEQKFNDSFRFVIFCEGKAQGATWYEDQAELICQAVNNHDRLSEENAQLKSDNAELVSALQDLNNHYCELINSGDAGNWNPNDEDVIKLARKLIQKHKEPNNGN